VKYFCVIFLLVLTGLSSETLWNDKMSDMYSAKVNFKINESVKIKINEKSVLNYKSTSKTLKSVSIDMKSEDVVGVFELIPEGSIDENKSGQDKDEFNYSGELQAKIVGISDNFITISGIKNVSINNKNSRVELSGDVGYKDMRGNVVLSSDIMNLSFKITTAIDSTVFPVLAEDFVLETKLETTVNENGETVENNVTTGKYKLSDDKKREFLLNYLNKILNVVF